MEVNGNKIGIEVDGPSHFVGRKPTGSTILKHRQVSTLDEIKLFLYLIGSGTCVGRIVNLRDFDISVALLLFANS